jgi:hypothetical protein
MNNTYGIVRPSTLDVNNDVEIWYNFKPNRYTNDSQYSTFTQVEDVTSMLSSAKIDDDTSTVLNGMFNLSLPVSIFGNTGIYTIYIKPKEIECEIKDIGALAAYPEIRGIVLDTQSITEQTTLFQSDNLVGYRIEYLDTNGNNERQDMYRIVTSCNKCEPVSQNLTSANTNSNGYRYNESGTLCFITVTPSLSPSFKPNATPYIGTTSQKIIISNTKFDPISIEVEMVEHDVESLWTSMNGNTIRSLDNGLVTVYNDNNEVFTQHEYYTLKDNYTTNDKYEVKKDREGNISYNDDVEEILNT